MISALYYTIYSLQTTKAQLPIWLSWHTHDKFFVLTVRITGFLPICQNQIQGLFKKFQGPYEGYIRRTKLANQHFYKHI